MKQMRVLWLTFIPSPYRLAFFEELAKHCELTVLFERVNSAKTRGNTWDNFSFNGYEGKVLSGITIGGYDKFCPSVVKYLSKKKYDIIVVSNPTSPTGILAAAVLRMKEIDYIVESDGAFPSHPEGIKKVLKQFVMNPAKYCLSTAKVHDEYYMECGVSSGRIRRYPFTSVYQKDIITSPISTSAKIEFRKTLGITEDKVIISVGQIIPRKGFDILLKAFASVTGEVGLYIIGGKATGDLNEIIIEKNLRNVHFIEFVKPRILREYYCAADMFVLPTREDIWGLVINEAMACGLPIISTSKCVAALELVKNGWNGYIVPVEDVNALLAAINNVLLDEKRRLEMSNNTLKKIDKYTFEEMAQCHINIFNNMH